jgi:hypothetical protein
VTKCQNGISSTQQAKYLEARGYVLEYRGESRRGCAEVLGIWLGCGVSYSQNRQLICYLKVHFIQFGYVERSDKLAERFQ